MFILWVAKPVLLPIALAILLSFVLSPIVLATQRRGVGRVQAVLLTVGMALLLIAMIGWGTAVQVQKLAAELPQHRKEISDKIDRLRGMHGGPVGELLEMVRDLDADGQAAPAGAPVVVAAPPRESSLAQIFGAVLPVLEPLATAGLVIVLVVFILINREDLRDRAIALAGHGRVAGTTRVIGDTAQRLSHFLLAQLFVNASLGALFALATWLIGVPFALLWGLLATILRFIPYVGTWLAAALPVLLSFALFPGWWHAVVLMAAFIVIDLVTANVVEPLLFGHNTGVTPVALLVAAAFWAWIWGPVGLVLSTPMTVCLVVLGQHVPRLRFLTLLLGGRPMFAEHVRYYQRLLAHDAREARERVDEYAREHGLAVMFDHVMIPALRLVRRDRKLDELSPQEEQAIYDSTASILDSLEEASAADAAGEPTAAANAVPPIIGVPAHHVAEELVVRMFSTLMKTVGRETQVLSSRLLPSEVAAQVERTGASVVFIAVLPPGGMPQAAYLCELLRERFPDVPIVVGFWGAERHFDRVLVRLRAAGASYVTTSLLQTRSQVEYLAKLARASTTAGT